MTLPIYEAVVSGNLDYFKQNNSKVNEKNERGWTPLHFAARFGQLEIAQFLKDNHADVSSITNDGKTPSDIAKLWGNQDLDALLAVAKTNDSPFPDNYNAVFAGNPLNR